MWVSVASYWMLIFYDSCPLILCQNLVEFSISYGQVLWLIMNRWPWARTPNPAVCQGGSQATACVHIKSRVFRSRIIRKWSGESFLSPSSHLSPWLLSTWAVPASLLSLCLASVLEILAHNTRILWNLHYVIKKRKGNHYYAGLCGAYFFIRGVET